MLDLEVLEHLGIYKRIGEPAMLDIKTERDIKLSISQPGIILSNGFYGDKPIPVSKLAPQARSQNL